jgi:ribonucleoside-triphosphate reductase
MPDIVNSQCCRLIFTPDSDELKDFRNGAMRMGSLQVVTINLPRLAYEAKGDDGKLFEILDEKMDLAKEVLLKKRVVIKERLADGALPFCAMDCFGETYLNLDKQVLNIGFVGLNELLKAHMNSEIHEDSAWRFGLKVIRHMVNRVNAYGEETGYRFGCIQTPAESCAHRLALVDRKAFGEQAILQGDIGNGGIYYTNSSHVRPSAGIPLFDRINIESSFHPLTKGGAIMHVWLGESNPSPEAVWKLIKRIATKSLAAYFAFTKDMTICKKCSNVESSLQARCNLCGADGNSLEHWSRITGYYQQLRGWNAGKLQEFKDRHRYVV